jgi:hypothetical protein
MPIASFKGKVFQVSANKIYTLNGLSWSGSLDTEAQEKLGDKPSTYIKGSNLTTMSFEIPLRVDFGHNVRSEIESWESIKEQRSPDIFILGQKPIGKNKWLLKTVTVENMEIDGSGNILKASLKLEFEEYVRAGKKQADTTKQGAYGTSFLVPNTIYATNVNDTRNNPNVKTAIANGVMPL